MPTHSRPTRSSPASIRQAGDAQVITDVRTLRALGHPVRMALVDALLPGPLSATEAGDLIGESATTCSFHLRQLAKYGLVQQHETGPGRRRTWKLSETRWRVPTDVLRSESAQVSMYETILNRFLRRAHRAVMSLAEERDPLWDEASTSSRSPFYLTRAELAEFSAHLDQLVASYRDRYSDRLDNAKKRPRDARPVEVILFAVPAPQDDEDF